ncbi:MAG TPA: hypothetical protein VIT64_01395 [Ilumatobacteraceae bacterium]
MTIQKSFKRLVRARMAKTGESYAAARAQLLAGAQTTPDQVGVPWLACSDARIRERTGMGWEEWFELLDSWEAEQLPHTEIARRVAELRGTAILGWDAQAVTTSFERSRGMRAVGERCGPDGFVASASKTIAAPADEIFRAVVDPGWRARWLPDLELIERSVTEPKSARFDVENGRTRLLVSVTPKAVAKATIAAEHSRLAGPEELEQQRAFWRAALVVLKDDLEGRAPSAGGSR